MLRNYKRDVIGSVDVAAGVTGVILSERWPIAISGAVVKLGIGVSDLTLWATAQFTLRVNGVPVRDYEDVRDQLGTIAEPSDVSVPIEPYSLVELVVKNGGAALGKFAGRFKIEEVEGGAR